MFSVQMSCAVLVLLVSIFYTVNEIECAVLLMSAANETGRMLIKNDRSVPLTVRGPGNTHTTQVPDTTVMMVNFTGWGEVVVLEENITIFRERVDITTFIVVRTHAKAHIAANFDRISMVQFEERLDLFMCLDGGSVSEHCLVLSESESRFSQDISLINNKISITQPPRQKNQNLVFVGNIVEQVSLCQNVSGSQDLLISGKGGHLTSIRKDKGITFVKQILEN